jgi:hypothetical protein
VPNLTDRLGYPRLKAPRGGLVWGEMGGRKQRQTDHERTAHALQEAQARSLDDLSEYEEFREMFLPAIRAALLKGMTSEQILAKFKPVMAARLVQLGVTGSENAALGAIKELLDRVDGKAVQKQEHTHRLAKLPDAELDAILQSKLNKTKVIEVTATPVCSEEGTSNDEQED